MKIKTFFKSFFIGFAVFVTSCASTSTKYETETLKVYVDRETVDDMDEEDISVQGADMKQLKNEKKLDIGIALNLVDESRGRAKLPPDCKLESTFWDMARNYLSRIHAYNVTLLPNTLTDNDLISGQGFQSKDYHFLLKMNIVLNSEIEERYDFDEAMYKTSIEWQLIDNRTKRNDLGMLDAPTIICALTCKNVTTRKLKVSSIRNRRMAGSNLDNAITAYRVTTENALIEFRAQLANRIPFGGKIESFKELDGDISMILKSGTDHGIAKRMQMLILNEEGDYIAVATAYPINTEKTRLKIWKWLSSSIKKQIRKAADKNASRDWMDEEGNALYAICLGMPSPSKDERDQIQDFTSK